MSDSPLISAALVAVLEEAQKIGAIGQAPIAEHAAHAAAFADQFIGQVEPCRCLLDIGSGGGIPGLVLAERCPDLFVALLDGRQQRTERLKGALSQLPFADRVTVIAERAELAARLPELRGAFDVVVARGFGSPPVTAECSAPFLRTAGLLVVSEPPGSTRRWPEEGCAILGLVPEAYVASPWAFVRLRQGSPCGERFPRRVGIPGKRPLFQMTD